MSRSIFSLSLVLALFVGVFLAEEASAESRERREVLLKSELLEEKEASTKADRKKFSFDEVDVEFYFSQGNPTASPPAPLALHLFYKNKAKAAKTVSCLALFFSNKKSVIGAIDAASVVAAESESSYHSATQAISPTELENLNSYAIQCGVW